MASLSALLSGSHGLSADALAIVLDALSVLDITYARVCRAWHDAVKAAVTRWRRFSVDRDLKAPSPVSDMFALPGRGVCCLVHSLQPHASNLRIYSTSGEWSEMAQLEADSVSAAASVDGASIYSLSETGEEGHAWYLRRRELCALSTVIATPMLAASRRVTPIGMGQIAANRLLVAEHLVFVSGSWLPLIDLARQRRRGWVEVFTAETLVRQGEPDRFVKGLRNPQGMAVHGTDLFVADEEACTICVCDASKAFTGDRLVQSPVARIIGGKGEAPGLFLGPVEVAITSGQLVVLESSRVQVLTLDGAPRQLLPLPGIAYGSMCMGNEAGEIYVVPRDRRSVTVLRLRM